MKLEVKKLIKEEIHLHAGLNMRQARALRDWLQRQMAADERNNVTADAEGAQLAIEIFEQLREKAL